MGATEPQRPRAGRGGRAGHADLAGRDTLVAGLLDLIQGSIHADDLPGMLRSAARSCAAALGDSAAVSVIHGPPAEADTIATSSRPAQTIDDAQAIAREGPGRTCWADQRTVVSAHLAADARWPALRPLVERLPPHAAVATPLTATPLTAGAHPAGVLTVYLRAEALGYDTVATVETLAAAVSAVLYELELRRELEASAANLERALLTRPAIDMAKGVIMSALRCGPDEAFAAMVRASKNGNVKVRDLAARIVADAAAGRPLALG